MTISDTSFKIYNIGDCILNGHYKVHSCYKDVINLIPVVSISKRNPEKLISIVTTKIGSGPNNIVINDPKYFDLINSIEIDSNMLKISIRNNMISLERNKLKIYRSSMKYALNSQLNAFSEEFNKEILLKMINFIKNLLIEISPIESLVFLLNRKQVNFEKKSSFQRKLEKKINKGVELTLKGLKNGKIDIKGLHYIKGHGYGLTPSGDDFIVGMFIALNFISIFKNNSYSKIIDQIYAESISENIFSNTFMYFAKEGNLYKSFTSLLFSIINGSESEIYENVRYILNQGATSGTDTLVGFILSISSIY